MPRQSNQRRKSNSRPRGTIQRHQKPATMSSKNRKSSEASRRISQNDPVTSQVPSDNGNVSGLSNQPNTSASDKLARIEAVHAKWDLEDLESSPSEVELKARQKARCKEMGTIMFDFSLQEAQIRAVWTLFYERKDLLLIAQTGFGKSLIFQLIPFISQPPGVVIILMPLKLLQAEQNAMINRLPKGKAIALTGENNQKETQQRIANGYYTHLFTSPEIALSKKFKTNILDHSGFAQQISLLAIDEIHLIEEWGKSF